MEYIFCFYLITGHLDLNEDCINPRTKAVLIDVAVSLELIHPFEHYSYFCDSGLYGWECSLTYLRSYYVNLSDAPPLADANRWPSLKIASAVLDFNDNFRKWLVMQPLDYSTIIKIKEENQHLRYVWSNILDARVESYPCNCKRMALKNLRDAIGEEAYYNGTLPPYVPIWRFQEIK